jgi:hypothetical protein
MQAIRIRTRHVAISREESTRLGFPSTTAARRRINGMDGVGGMYGGGERCVGQWTRDWDGGVYRRCGSFVRV